MEQRHTKIWVTLVLTLLFISCGQKPEEKTENILAYVNNEPIFAAELNGILERTARQDPSYAATPQERQEQLEFLIDKKLIIQEAVNAGLAREEKFVEAIKSYWEQTLIRDFIDQKSKGYRELVKVTDQDIQEYYGNLDKVVTFIVLKNKDRAVIDQAREKVIAKDDAALPWERIGPVRYSQIESPALRQAFALEVGNFQMAEEGGESYLIRVVHKEMIPVKPLENLREDIEKEIIAGKEKELFEGWLTHKRKSAQIKLLSP